MLTPGDSNPDKQDKPIYEKIFCQNSVEYFFLGTKVFIARKFAIPVFLALIAAGLAGNYFKFSLFLNIDLLFGSIFAMLALQFFGYGPGILAAALIAGSTYFLLNHPYAIIILTAEVAFVGWLMGRRKLGLVMADTLYWLLIGMPLVYFFYYFGMQVTYSNTLIIMIKQAVNCIANALIARLLFTGYLFWSRSALTSYREIVYDLLVFFVLFPVLIIVAIESRSDLAEIDFRIRNSLIHDSQRVVRRLETWVANRRSAIVNLAEMAASRTAQQMQPFLEQVKKSDLNFQRIGLQNREAITTAYFPLVDELGKSNIGRNFADRPFIPTLKQTLKPMLSDVALSRVGIPKPRVIMLAPIVIQGEYGGYVAGILNLDQIQDTLDLSVEGASSFYTLLDKNGNIIMTNRTDQKVMTPFRRGPVTIKHLDKGISQWIPMALPNTPKSELWNKSYYVVENSIGNLAEWQLILEQPVLPFQKTLYKRYTGKLALLFLIFFVSLVLAEFLSRRLIATIETLRQLTSDFPRKLASDTQIDWPTSSIREGAELIENFRETAGSLTAQFVENRQIIAEMRESRQQLLDIIDFFPDPTFVVDNEKRVIAWNRAMEKMSGVSKAEMLGQGDHAYSIPFYGDRRQNLLDLLDESNADLESKYTEVLRENGILYGEAFCPALYSGKGAYVWATVAPLFDIKGVRVGAIESIRDTTERRQAQELLKQANAELEQRVRARTAELSVTNTDLTAEIIQHKLTMKALQLEKERLLLALAASQQSWFDLDIPTGAVQVSPEYPKMIGYYPAEFQASLQGWIAAIHPEDRDGIRQAFQEFLATEETKSMEYRRQTKTGDWVWIRSTGKVIEFDVDGRPLRVIGTHADISGRKRAEEQLRRALKEKDVLLKEVYHRVKNNMQVIYSLLNLQAKGIADKGVRVLFEESRNRVRSMAIIHEQLYRSDDLAHIDFKEYLQTLVAGIADTYKRHGVVLSVEMEKISLDITIGIPCGLIVNELISNSFKYAFPDGKRGTIKVWIQQDGQGNNVLTVQDNGIGLPVELDFRNSPSLGLQLVNMLTQQIQGQIELVSDEGACFRITFPGTEHS